MTIDEAIKKHIILSNENMTAGAEWYQKYINYQDHDYKNFADKCEKTAQEHKQYAEWLKELKELRMRDATLEERKSVDNYVKSISKDTGVTFEQNSSSQMPGTSDLIDRRTLKEQMIKYGFTAPDMTVTEFVDDCLPSVQPEIIRCKDCEHWRQQTNFQGFPLLFGFCESDDMWRSLYGKTTEIAHIDTDYNHYCGFAERRTDE